MGKAGEANKKSGKQMKRSLGTASVFAICTGAMFSSGFFLLPGLAADESGPSIPLVYLAASLLMLPAIFTLGELSSAIPRAGGPYLFLHRSMGSLMGLTGAIAYYIQLLLKGAFAFVGIGTYLMLLLEVPIQPVAIGLIVLFTALNLLGVQQTARTEIILVAILLLLLTYFVISGLVEVNSSAGELQERFQPLFPAGFEGIFSGVALVFVSYGGVGQIASLAEEIRKPARSIPRGMLIAISVSTLFYFLGTGIMVALLSPENLRDNQVPVATAAEQFRALPLPVLVVVCAALAAFASTGNAAILSAARYPLALARDKLLWHKFGKLDSKGVPKISVIFTGFVLILLVLAFDVENIAKLGSAFLLFVFWGMCIALIIFRESRSREYDPGYRSPLYPWTQIAGIIIYTALIIKSGFIAMGLIAGICIVGALWFLWGVREHASKSAAVYELFGRLAQKHNSSSSAGIGVSALGDIGLAQLTQRAIILDIEEEISLEKAIQKAADALKNHLGGDRKAIAEHLQAEVSHWKSPIRANVLISPALLQGIEQAEMVAIRGRITVEDTTYRGLIVLVDDKQSPNRLLSLLSQLKESIFHSHFEETWQRAEGAKELKEALVHDIKNVQSMTLQVEEAGPTASLKGSHLKEANMPDGSLVALVQRDAQTMVPDGQTRFRTGDKLTIIANEDAMEKIRKRYDNPEQ